jgi:hypothetical protein
LVTLPLHTMVIEEHFQWWGLDFIREFKEKLRNGFKWIITVTDYWTRWVEAIPTKRETNKVVMEFLEDKIIATFNIPTNIKIDNAKAFNLADLSCFCFNYGIILSHSYNYYP